MRVARHLLLAIVHIFLPRSMEQHASPPSTTPLTEAARRRARQKRSHWAGGASDAAATAALLEDRRRERAAHFQVDEDDAGFAPAVVQQSHTVAVAAQTGSRDHSAGDVLATKQRLRRGERAVAGALSPSCSWCGGHLDGVAICWCGRQECASCRRDVNVTLGQPRGKRTNTFTVSWHENLCASHTSERQAKLNAVLHQAARDLSTTLYGRQNYLVAEIALGGAVYAAIGAAPRNVQCNTRATSAQTTIPFTLDDPRGLFVGEIVGDTFLVVGGNTPLKWQCAAPVQTPALFSVPAPSAIPHARSRSHLA